VKARNRPVPELPEVEVVRRGLTAHLVGRRIADVQVFHDRAVRRHAGGAADFRAVLPGHAITAVRRRGKYLWWALHDGQKFAESLDYAPLPAKVVTLVEARLKELSAGGKKLL
jgi:hypothetical protein